LRLKIVFELFHFSPSLRYFLVPQRYAAPRRLPTFPQMFLFWSGVGRQGGLFQASEKTNEKWKMRNGKWKTIFDLQPPLLLAPAICSCP